jgi:hypothetical protein
MADLLTEQGFTEHLVERLKPFNIEIVVPESLVVELHYGPDEPVLSIPLKATYEQYLTSPDNLDGLVIPYVTEISWTVQPPRFKAREIFERTMPLMRDLTRDPILQDGEKIVREGKEMVMRLPKGPVLYNDLITRDDEHLVVQYMLEKDDELLELYRGDVLTCFPEPTQIAEISMQNLARRALESGLTTRVYKIENFQTEPVLVGFREESLANYAASLINIHDVMLALEKNLEAPDGLIAAIPARNQLFIGTKTDEQAVCELWLLARHLKGEASAPASSLIWKFKEGEITGVQTVNLKEQQ